jgi:hypothetical protein
MSAIFDLIGTNPCTKTTVDGKEFFTKTLSGFERDVFEAQWLDYKQDDSVIGIRAFMVAFCLCDSDGKRTFNSGDSQNPRKDFLEAVEKIGEIPASKLQPLFLEAMNQNGFSDAEVIELEKK